MKDYIKEGLSRRLAPADIYDNICEALENPNLSEEDRNALMQQKEKAEKIAKSMSDIFNFPSI